MKRRTQKRSLILFELLISLALIALCLFPLIKIHAFMRTADSKGLLEIQMKMVEQEAFCILKDDLYHHRIKWEQLTSFSGILQPVFKVVTSRGATRNLTCTYSIQSLEHCDKPSLKKIGLVVLVDLHFSPCSEEFSHFQRTLYLERREL